MFTPNINLHTDNEKENPFAPMASITYEIDPGGDLDLVLRDPNTQRIVPIINKEKGDSNDAFDNPPLVGRYEVFNSLNGTCKDQARAEGTSVDVHFRVSSRHLILASRTFHKMLEGGWSESSSAPNQSGRRQIYTSSWDAPSLAIVLDAIHGRYQDIPKYTNLGLLTRITTIVDYYQCHGSIQLIIDLWVATLRASCKVPTDYCQNTLLWLYISWVFSEKDISSPITKMLFEESGGLSEIHLFDLPLGGIIDVIEIKNQKLIGRLTAALEDLREELSEEKGCLAAKDPNCSAIMLGILIREQRKFKLLDPPLAYPYSGHSISSLRARIGSFPRGRPEKRTIYPATWATRPKRIELYHRGPHRHSQEGFVDTSDEELSHATSCTCTVSDRLKGILEGIERDIVNFDPTVEQGRKG